MYMHFRKNYIFRIHHLIWIFTISCVCIVFVCSSKNSLGDDLGHITQKTISMQEAVSIAVKRNPQLQSMRDQVEAALGALKQTKLYPNPVIRFLAEEMPSNEIGLNESENLISITQPIITGGKRRLEIEISEKTKEKSQLERDTVLLEVIAGTKKAFYKALANKEGLSVAKETKKIVKKIYESEKIRFEAGEVALTNVLRAEVEWAKAKNLVSRTNGQLQNALKELQTVMGVSDAASLNISGKLLKTPAELSVGKLERMMKDNHPVLKAYEKGIEIANTQLTLEQRKIIPDISVSVGYKRISQEDADTIQFGLGIPVPFFDRNQGNVQKGRALSKRAKSKSLSIYQNMLFQLRKNLNLYNVEKKRISEFKENILPRAEEALDLITKGYKEGEFSYIDLLDTQRIWTETRVSYIELVKQLNLIITDIERLAVTKIGK